MGAVITRITFHGISTYSVEGPAGRVLIDPYLTDSASALITDDECPTPDVIVVSHAAWDHMASVAPIALRTGAPVMCGFDTAALLREAGVPDAQLRVSTVGLRAGFGGIVVTPVPSMHWSQATLADGSIVSGVPMAFIVDVGSGTRVYHFGDSALTAEMELIGRVHQPAVALVGVTQPWSLVAEGGGEVLSGEMSPTEAALAAELLGARIAVATHYEDADHPHVAQFLEAVAADSASTGRVGLALRPEETLVIDGESHRIEAAR